MVKTNKGIRKGVDEKEVKEVKGNREQENKGGEDDKRGVDKGKN